MTYRIVGACSWSPSGRAPPPPGLTGVATLRGMMRASRRPVRVETRHVWGLLPNPVRNRQSGRQAGPVSQSSNAPLFSDRASFHLSPHHRVFPPLLSATSVLLCARRPAAFAGLQPPGYESGLARRGSLQQWPPRPQPDHHAGQRPGSRRSTFCEREGGVEAQAAHQGASPCSRTYARR